MTVSLGIPPNVTQLQHDASDPLAAAWVSANAGSGKTFVLAQRVIRLLLGRTDPAKILCLTFTKAAAANMATVVFERLSKWTTLDDASLDAEIRTMSSVDPGAEQRALARQLFARTLETPGGLKVQTIHAFCTRILQQFPFESKVAAGFAVMDDTTQRQLLEQLTLDVLLEASARPDSALGRALDTAIKAGSDQTFRDVVREAIGRRDQVKGFVDRAGGLDAALAELAQALGISPDDSRDGIEKEFLTSPHIAASEWLAIADALAQGKKSDCDTADVFRRMSSLSSEERLFEYLSIFCTRELEPRKRVVTSDISKRDAALYQRLTTEQERICALVPRWRAVRSRDRSAALITVAHAVIARYETDKARRGLLDYDDLIDNARDLLNNYAASWVHYKLDQGIDHVLIDEAQDTSPKQWEVVEKLTQEFTSGAGARSHVRRSVFAVGDDKQSIFSFQGADPKEFAEKRSLFKRAFDEGGLSFREIEFKYSFRSVQTVLDAVDLVCKEPAVYKSLSATDQAPTAHMAVRSQTPGLVEIWSLEPPAKTKPVEGWKAPFDDQSETSARVRLARKIAIHVDAMVASGEPIGEGDTLRPVRPGDILVLVRQRGSLFEAIIRALKNAAVPVAGADRLLLDQHIAVMDLIALADALLLPDDDLALATVLKSPLFGFSEEDLFGLAYDRPASLVAALRAKTLQDVRYERAQALLDRLSDAARLETPFAFYARVLGPEQGRRRFLARLGPEANDALDEFLNLALDYEQTETPSLQGFIGWLRTANAEVKRDMEIRRDEVRVMTVHGAKGLEAPVVILADTTTKPTGPYPPRFLSLPANLPPGAAPPFVWAGRKEDDPPPAADARAKANAAAEDEYRRLLYVAMTRAADRLLVCGALTMHAKPEGCWYDLIQSALAPHSQEETMDDGGTVWRFSKGTKRPAGALPAQPQTLRLSVELPTWLSDDASSLPQRLKPLAPSRLFDETTNTQYAVGTGVDRKTAMLRGGIMHRLLQSLPDLPLEARAEAARQFLLRNAQEFSPADRDAMALAAIALLDDAQFKDVFAAGSRAEVSIAGEISHANGVISVAGQVDRLAVTSDGVLIADYKTNRPAPQRLDQVPDAYVAQLALYRAVLAMLYPGKTVRAALLFTAAPVLFEVPADMLDEAFKRFL